MVEPRSGPVARWKSADSMSTLGRAQKAQAPQSELSQMSSSLLSYVWMELLCERAHLTDRHEYRKRVLFFDDDPENIRDCVLAGFKRSTHTPDGFTRSALAAIASRAGRKRGACAMA